MIIDFFYVVRAVILPNKANPPLIVNSNTMLSHSIARELFQPVPWRRRQIEELCRGVQHDQLPLRDFLDPREFLYSLASEKLFSASIFEAPDH